MVSGKFLAVSTVGLLVVGAMSVQAAGRWPGGPWADKPIGQLIRGQIGRLLVLQSELNLTGEQKSQIGGILRGQKQEIAVAAKGVWDKRVALRNAVLAENPDEAAIRKAADELGKAIGDAAVLGSKVAGEVRPVLTEEQRKQIGQTRQESEEAVERFFQKVMAGE